MTCKRMGGNEAGSENVKDFGLGVEIKNEPISQDELDMTPMVDVTFLLLIFFMVTASFVLQKSLEQPHANTDQSSPEPILKLEDDYVQVTVDQTNTFHVMTRGSEEEECPSDNEMRSRVKDAIESTSANRLIVLAHVDSQHSKVITAWDAGAQNRMKEIEIKITEQDF